MAVASSLSNGEAACKRDLVSLANAGNAKRSSGISATLICAIKSSQSKLFIRGGAFYDERNAFSRQRCEGVRGDGGLAGFPGLEREAAREVAQCSAFHVGVCESDDDHSNMVM